MSKPEMLKVTTKEPAKTQNKLKFSLCTLVLILFCSILIVVATFTQISFLYYDQIAGAHLKSLLEFLRLIHLDGFFTYPYIPQVPVILFIASLLGGLYGLLSVLLYVVVGILFFPVFAMGGGIKYFAEYSFGYIIAFIPTVLICGYMLKNNTKFSTYLKTLLVGVALINIIGLIYLFFVVLLRHDSFAYAYEWVSTQGGIKVLYDFLYGLFALYLGHFFRMLV